MKRLDLHVTYGDDPTAMIRDLLEKIRPETFLDRQGKIGIKPNLVVPKPSSSGATTSPLLVAGLIEHLQANGFENLCILEGSGIGDQTPRAFERCGYRELSRRFQVPLIDMQTDPVVTRQADGLEIKIGQTVTTLDHLINMPVLKAHCQTKITCALKNLKGLIPDSEKRRFHMLGLHRPIAALAKIIPQDLILVDGLMGDLTFEEGGHPVRMNRIIAARDPVLCDAYAAELLGHEPSDIDYILRCESLGVGSAALERATLCTTGDDRASALSRRPTLRERFASPVVEDKACSACYGSLMHAMQRLSEAGTKLPSHQKIYIGQGFSGESENDGLGIGACTAHFPRHVPGCPPSARQIAAALRQENS